MSNFIEKSTDIHFHFDLTRLSFFNTYSICCRQDLTDGDDRWKPHSPTAKMSLFNRVVHSQEPRCGLNNDRKRPAKRDFCSNKKKTKFHLKQLSGNPRDFTIMSDEVHQSIDICPVMKVLIDTEPFQRLRNIKQLGVTNLVYSCADHNRFQHSIGVSYLAREMCTRIKNKQRNLNTTDKDVLCVTLAGLLHDIGHGPFSHIFEAFRGSLHAHMRKDPTLKKHYDENFPRVPKEWSHEHSSLLMIDAALKSLGLEIDMENLDKPLKQIGDGIDARSMRVFKHFGGSDYSEHDIVLTSRDFIFIKECIFGKPIPQVVEKVGKDDLIGRLEKQKEWLYDIVANRHSGLDVDKMDYFARDERRSLSEAGKINLQILYNALVAKATCSRFDCKKCSSGEKHFMICYPKKCVEEVMSFFRFRFKMHGTVYQHKTSSAAAAMVVDILLKADPYLAIEAGGEHHSISSAVVNQEAFLGLKDSIIEDIYNSSAPELQPARDLARRFMARDLYKLAGELNIKPSDKKLWEKAKTNPEAIVREICSFEGSHTDDSGETVFVAEDDVIVEHCAWHYGRKDQNPLSAVRFVNREELGCTDEILTAHEVDEEDYETIIPRSFMKKCIRVYSRNPSKTELVMHKFLAWKENLFNDSGSPVLNTQTYSGFLQRAEVSVLERVDRDAPIALTQDSGDEDEMYTPIKNRIRQKTEDPSPIPLPSFNLK
eukprot:scaffold346_cov116-Cylindrotheca_fusiformis.AAC.38